MEEILKLIVNYGLTTVLFIFLFFYNLKDSKEREIKYQEREVKYQEIIEKLSEKFGVIEEVKQDVEEIKNKLI